MQHCMNIKTFLKGESRGSMNILYDNQVKIKTTNVDIHVVLHNHSNIVNWKKLQNLLK